MVSTDAVRRALSALATRTDTASRPYVAVVDEADAARTDLRRAAGFLDAVGLDRLDEAVATAEREGNADLAERGRDALADYRALRAAAAGESSASADRESDDADRESSASADRESDDADREPSASADRESDDGDHFHPAPGTPKGESGQGSSR